MTGVLNTFLLQYLTCLRTLCRIGTSSTRTDLVQIRYCYLASCQVWMCILQVKVVGGTFPVSTVRGDILVDLTYMNRLLGLDVHQQT